MRSNKEAVAALKLKSAKRNAELVPDYPFKKMPNGKTFIYYRTCSVPCATFIEDKLIINNEIVKRGPIKQCLLYLRDNKVGVK